MSIRPELRCTKVLFVFGCTCFYRFPISFLLIVTTVWVVNYELYTHNQITVVILVDLPYNRHMIQYCIPENTFIV